MKLQWTFVLVFCITLAAAQDHKLEINLRASVITPLEMEAQYYDKYVKTYPFSFSFESLFFPKSYFGIGGYFTRNVSKGMNVYFLNGGYYESEEVLFDMLSYGLTAQVTTNRKKRVRLYGVGRVGQLEMLEEFSQFTMGSSGVKYSAGLGLMIRVSPILSFNVFDASYVWLPKEFVITNDKISPGAFIQSGFSVKLLKKR